MDSISTKDFKPDYKPLQSINISLEAWNEIFKYIFTNIAACAYPQVLLKHMKINCPDNYVWWSVCKSKAMQVQIHTSNVILQTQEKVVKQCLKIVHLS